MVTSMLVTCVWGMSSGEYLAASGPGFQPSCLLQSAGQKFGRHRAEADRIDESRFEGIAFVNRSRQICDVQPVSRSAF